MREIELTLVQRLVNRTNCRVNFTKELCPSSGSKGRYVVTSQEIFRGTNPSMAPGLRLKIAEAAKKPCIFIENGFYFNSIGGWTDPETNEYYVGANLHFYNLDSAVRAAKQSDQIAIFDRHTDKVIYLRDLIESDYSYEDSE